MPVDPTRKILKDILQELKSIQKELHHIRQVFEYEYFTKPREKAAEENRQKSEMIDKLEPNIFSKNVDEGDK